MGSCCLVHLFFGWGSAPCIQIEIFNISTASQFAQVVQNRKDFSKVSKKHLLVLEMLTGLLGIWLHDAFPFIPSHSSFLLSAQGGKGNRCSSEDFLESFQVSLSSGWFWLVFAFLSPPGGIHGTDEPAARAGLTGACSWPGLEDRFLTNL